MPQRKKDTYPQSEKWAEWQLMAIFGDELKHFLNNDYVSPVKGKWSVICVGSPRQFRCSVFFTSEVDRRQAVFNWDVRKGSWHTCIAQFETLTWHVHKF